jgi:hypothetical protein
LRRAEGKPLLSRRFPEDLLKAFRFTPSGTRIRLAAPIRPNSAAAQLVVQITRC